MILGVQLYGLLSMGSQDEKELFTTLKDMGIHMVEPCVTFKEGEGETGPFWSVEKFESLLPLIKTIGLRAESIHIASDNILLDAEKMAALAKRTGIKNIVLQTPAPYTELNLQEAAFKIRSLAETVEKAGVRLLLHNGAADINAKVLGRTAYEYLVDICLGKIGMQVDVGWVAAGGMDPKELLARNEARIESLHFKDFVDPGVSKEDTFIGNGAVDTDLCMQFGRAKGIPLYIDQDVYTSFPEDCKKSYDYLMLVGQFRAHTVSYLNILDTETKEVKILKKFDGVVEAPNWVGSLNSLVYNSEGRIYLFNLDTLESTMIDSGFCTECNNDHVVSADEKEIAVSCSYTNEFGGGSHIFTLPLTGGEPKLATKYGPSYLHGWSPDKKDLAYCAFRTVDGELHVDVYTISPEGGEEKRLTTEGFNDGPEYSWDGKHIWFISTRSGLMQVYRMNADGSDQRQMTFENQNNWFGHVSPDNKKVVNLAYYANECLAGEHLPNMKVELWMMNYDGSNREKILGFFGGQGSINVNSWAPDSRHLAFVSYDIEL